MSKIEKPQFYSIVMSDEELERAAYNRYIVENRLFTTAYRTVENYLRYSPQNKLLPLWMPRGELPTVGRRELRDFSGEGRGFEVED